MRQSLLWIPIGKPFGPDDSLFLRIDPIPYKGEKPKRLWTLYEDVYSNVRPILPYHPVHNFNAFLEDYMHSWNIFNGYLDYYSHISNGGTWALLEFIK